MGLYQMKGRRPYMEDTVAYSPDLGFYAVFDGHGGLDVAKYLQNNILPVMDIQSKNFDHPLTSDSYSKLLTDSIETIDERVLANKKWSRIVRHHNCHITINRDLQC